MSPEVGSSMRKHCVVGYFLPLPIHLHFEVVALHPIGCGATVLVRTAGHLGDGVTERVVPVVHGTVALPVVALLCSHADAKREERE